MAVDDSLLRERAAARPRPMTPGDMIRDYRSRVNEPDRGGMDANPPPAGDGLQPAEDESEPLPTKEGSTYIAYSQSRNKPELMLSLMLKDGSYEILAYGDLRRVAFEPARLPGKAPVLVLYFIGVAEVRMEGRHLKTLLEPFRRHRIGWCRELATQDFFEGETVVISKIVVAAAE
jgi:hypothetical protein